MHSYPIILLPGWRLPTSKYTPLIEELRKKKYQVFALDQPGFIESKPLKRPYTLNDYVEYLHTFIQSKKFKHIILLGHSFGGRVAIRFSAQYPEIVESLILTGTPGVKPVSSVKTAVFEYMSKFGNSMISVPPFSSAEKPLRKVWTRLTNSYDYQKTSGELRETFLSIIHDDLKQNMSRIQCPTLLLWGNKDQTVPTAVAQQMREVIQGSVLTILETYNHTLPYQAPQECAEIIDAFIKEEKKS